MDTAQKAGFEKLYRPIAFLTLPSYSIEVET